MLEEHLKTRLEPPHAAYFDVSVIQAINFPAGGRVVRVTGVNLEKIRKLAYDQESHAAHEWYGGPSHGRSD